jgi:hypothetical protein
MSAQKPTWLSAIVTLFGRNALTLFGATLAGVSAVLIIGFLILGLLELTDSPYIGIMAFLILPVVFVGGLLLIPVGAYWERRRIFRGGAVKAKAGPFPVIDLNDPHTRRVAAVVAVVTMVNLLIIATVSYEGVNYMDSVAFCGRVCHAVMEPEYTAYTNSPHGRVRCIECHIGPGAPWFVRSKLSGIGQVIAVTFNTYPRPIPTPVENLRPSRDTCEQCHWPEQFAGDRLKVITKFDDDEANTPKRTVLLMHIGGGKAKDNGIHSWHIDPNKRTIYTPADPKRQEIARVRVERADGTATFYHAPKDKYPPEKLVGAEERVMDCIDCHNRPTHIFKLPAQAVDEAMAAGRIDPKLPYIKKVSVEALTEAKGAAGDLKKVQQHVRSYYQEHYGDLYRSDSARVDAAVRELQAIYSRNVFPNMNLGWGVHPNNLGHEQPPGCFRCHDDSLQTDDGKSIGQDCTVCHAVLAWDEADPQILQKLGLQ